MKKVYTVYQTATFGIVVEADNIDDAEIIANEMPTLEWICVEIESTETFEGDEFDKFDKGEK